MPTQEQRTRVFVFVPVTDMHSKHRPLNRHDDQKRRRVFWLKPRHLDILLSDGILNTPYANRSIPFRSVFECNKSPTRVNL